MGMMEYKEKIEKYIEDGLLIRQWHNNGELQILNYSQQVQYSGMWDNLTTQCRGLILTKDYSIASRPFGKFHNYEQVLDKIPNEPFEVYQKLDGSLAISYWWDDKPFIATRGSFESDQAKKATEILYSKYPHTFSKLKRDRTYLWEIIYRTNRIVVNYGDMEDLILLSVIDNETGKDMPLEDIGFPIVKKYNGITDVSQIKGMIKDDEEGFVVKFQNGFRCKVKGDEYCRLHKILTQTSSKVIWEFLKDNKKFDELIDRIPDEFHLWLRDTKEGLENQYNEIEQTAKAAFNIICLGLYKEYGFPDEGVFGFATPGDIVRAERFKKKDFALRVMANPEFKKISGILFNMLIGKEYKDIIWKSIKPEYERPFKSSGQIEG